MATMTFSLVVGATTYTKSTTFANADATRLLAAYLALYAPPANIVGGNPSPLTNDQVFQALVAGIFDGIRANVLAHEKATQQPAIAPLPMA